MEDEEQNIHFKNLSVHRAGSEEEALNLVRDMLRATCQLGLPEGMHSHDSPGCCSCGAQHSHMGPCCMGLYRMSHAP